MNRTIELHQSVTIFLDKRYPGARKELMCDTPESITAIQEFLNANAEKIIFVNLISLARRRLCESWIAGVATYSPIHYSDESIVLPMEECHSNNPEHSGLNISPNGNLIMSSSKLSGGRFAELNFLHCCRTKAVKSAIGLEFGCEWGNIKFLAFRQENLREHLKIVFGKTGTPVPSSLLTRTIQ